MPVDGENQGLDDGLLAGLLEDARREAMADLRCAEAEYGEARDASRRASTAGSKKTQVLSPGDDRERRRR